MDALGKQFLRWAIEDLQSLFRLTISQASSKHCSVNELWVSMLEKPWTAERVAKHADTPQIRALLSSALRTYVESTFRHTRDFDIIYREVDVSVAFQEFFSCLCKTDEAKSRKILHASCDTLKTVIDFCMDATMLSLVDNHVIQTKHVPSTVSVRKDPAPSAASVRKDPAPSAASVRKDPAPSAVSVRKDPAPSPSKDRERDPAPAPSKDRERDPAPSVVSVRKDRERDPAPSVVSVRKDLPPSKDRTPAARVHPDDSVSHGDSSLGIRTQRAQKKALTMASLVEGSDYSSDDSDVSDSKQFKKVVQRSWSPAPKKIRVKIKQVAYDESDNSYNGSDSGSEDSRV